jgi:hypothetical protein
MNPKKRFYLFGPKNCDRMRWDSVATYSVTPHQYGTIMVDSIKKWLEQYSVTACDLVLTDACACIGCDTIRFCGAFKWVHAVEVNAQRHGHLLHNTRVMQVRNLDTHCADFVKIMHGLVQDVVYFDPPWPGARNYKKVSRCRLTLSGQPIEDLCKALFMNNQAKWIVIKAPNNFDHQSLSPMGPAKVVSLGPFCVIMIARADFHRKNM